MDEAAAGHGTAAQGAAGHGGAGNRPVIGITTHHEEDPRRDGVGSDYVEGVLAAGGIPLLIPNVPAEAVVHRLPAVLDGLLLTGGVDLDPAWFDEDPARRLGRVCPERDALELPLARAALAADLPVLAICRGIQVLNVAAGGTLYQDIPSQLPGSIKHSQQAPRWHASHTVTVEPGSLLADLLAPGTLKVNSFHHQALRAVAEGFRVTAVAPDEVIEAVESTRHRFVLGVQWHPENMWQRDPLFLGLFKGLVETAAAGVGHGAGRD